MDQVKQVLRVLMQHRFWVLSGVITLIGVGIWFMSTSALVQEFESGKTKIEGQYSKVNQVLTVENHPNDFSHKRMDEINAGTKERVYQAWMTQWDRQRAVLVWPAELEKDFEAVVSNLRPAEAIAFPTPREKEIGIEYRTRYRDYIQTVIPYLAKIIDSNWDAKGGGGSASGAPGMGGSGLAGFGAGAGGVDAGAGAPGMGGGAATGATAAEPSHVVFWEPRNQSSIASRYDWSSRADNMPKTLEILYAQEDLWILSSLMNVVARTNDGADARYKATIKRITSIDLGVEAQLGGSVQRLGGGGTGLADGGPGAMPGMPGMSAPGGSGPAPPGASGAGTPPMSGSAPPGMGKMSGESGMAGSTGGTASVDPLDNRYVDIDLQPLKATRIREALQVRDPKDALLAVVKRMPVRLQLVVDIRRLNRLLSECGNSDLPLEIRQVRINKQGAASGGGGGGGMGGDVGASMMGPGMGAGPPGMAGAGMGGGMAGMGGGMAGMGGPSMGGRGRLGGGGGTTVEDDTFETKIEIFGLVYLFNPVNEAKLGPPKQNGAVPGTTAGGAAPPVGTTGAAGTATAPSS